MLVKKISRWVLSTLTVMLTIGGMVWGLGAMTTSVRAETTIPGKGSPSQTPTGILGIYAITGFSLQPTNQYTFVNNPKTLTTATVHSVLDSVNLMGEDHFTWYQSTDAGKTWTTVSNETSANLTVKPTEVGTTYYQQSFRYYAGLFPGLAATYYSNVVSVKTLPNAVNATGLNVTTKDNYLYNNQSTAATTYAEATPTPSNATGNLTWSIDNNNLATIDPTTGEITANTKGLSGTVKVTGTLSNKDTASTVASTTVDIGGGLDNQTVDQGKTATFSIRGNFDTTSDSVVWHKVDTSGKDTVISGATGVTYTTPATTAADDKTKYFAVITTTANGTSNSVTTNKTTLNVNVPIDDQTVSDGKKATFSIKGDLGVTPSSIVWHRIDTSGTDSKVSSGTSTSYTTPATKVSDDNGAKYYAVITATINGTATTLTTKQATLNVNAVDHSPKVIISSKMVDLTNNNGNTDHELTNVIAGDQAKITGTMTDENTDSSLTQGTLLLKMPGDISNIKLYIDDKLIVLGALPTAGNVHATSVPDGQGNATITISGINFATTKQHTYELDFTSNTTTNTPFTTVAQLIGTDSSGNSLDTYNGEELTINFVDGLLHADASNVDFGTLTYGDVGEQVTGTVDGNLLNVIDNRRDKTAQVITLRQNSPFNNGSHDLAATLSFDNNGAMTPLNTADQEISSTKVDAKVPSIGPDNNQSLKLQLANAPIQVGSYTTTLDWTITSAP